MNNIRQFFFDGLKIHLLMQLAQYLQIIHFGILVIPYLKINIT